MLRDTAFYWSGKRGLLLIIILALLKFQEWLAPMDAQKTIRPFAFVGKC